MQVSDALRGHLSHEDVCVPGSESTVPDLKGLEDSYQANHTHCDFAVDYYSMQYSLFINNVVEIVGGFFFLITAIYIISDTDTSQVSKHLSCGPAVFSIWCVLFGHYFTFVECLSSYVSLFRSVPRACSAEKAKSLSVPVKKAELQLMLKNAYPATVFKTGNEKLLVDARHLYYSVQPT